MTKKLFILFSLSVLFSLSYHLFFRPVDETTKKEIELRQFVFPKADKFSNKIKNSYYAAYKVKDNKETQIGIVFNTKDIEHNIFGYTDKINMLVGLSNNGVIEGITVLEHKETPGFFNKLEEVKFIDKFKGKKILKPLIFNKDIDTITGATISSAAMINTINFSIGHYSQNVLNVPEANFPLIEKVSFFDKLKKDLLLNWMSMLILTGIIILGIVAYYTANRTLWIMQAFLSLFFLGLHYKVCLSILNIFSATFVSFNVLSKSIVILTLFLVFILFGFLIPRFFCGYICPYGALMRLFYAGTNKNLKLSDEIKKTKYFILIITLLIFTITLKEGYVDIEPFVVLFNQVFTTYNVIYICVFVFSSFFIAHFWCNYFCPLGALGGILSKLSFGKKKINDNCIKCNLCVKVCPHNAIIKKADNTLYCDAAECFSCQECVRKCPKNAIV